jgi:hypothetical protein
MHLERNDYPMKARLPPLVICPSCARETPIAEMAINKLPTIATAKTEGLKAHRPNMWEFRCADCDPQSGEYFWFPLERCNTPAKALDCIMQINDERWSPAITQSFIALVEKLFGRGALDVE